MKLTKKQKKQLNKIIVAGLNLSSMLWIIQGAFIMYIAYQFGTALVQKFSIFGLLANIAALYLGVQAMTLGILIGVYGDIYGKNR